MALDVRGMARREWTQIRRRESVFAPVDSGGFRGHAGLMRILEVSEPFVRRVTLADAGYSWLQLAPAGGHWWLTVMYDPAGTLVQYYFDITWRNFVAESGEPMFEDLYLDVVMQPDGQLRLLDQDELDAARAAGAITADQYALALRELDALCERLRGREREWRCLCAREKARLEALLEERRRAGSFEEPGG